jgi:formyltetrahydrofolate synthetase
MMTLQIAWMLKLGLVCVGAGVAGILVQAVAAGEEMELRQAVVVTRPGELPKAEGVAATVLVEEVQKRTGLLWRVTTDLPETGTAIEISGTGDARAAEAAGARVAVSKHWAQGGDWAVELAEAVLDACEEEPKFRLLYEDDVPLKDKISRIATEVYGAGGVSYSEIAEAKVKQIQAEDELRRLGVCMVKTHLSLSHDPERKGRPKEGA